MANEHSGLARERQHSRKLCISASPLLRSRFYDVAHYSPRRPSPAIVSKSEGEEPLDRYAAASQGFSVRQQHRLSCILGPGNLSLSQLSCEAFLPKVSLALQRQLSVDSFRMLYLPCTWRIGLATILPQNHACSSRCQSVASQPPWPACYLNRFRWECCVFYL